MVSRVFRRLALTGGSMLGLCMACPQAMARCENLLPAMDPPPGPERGIAPEDLVRLRQIGQPQALFSSRSALAASPDGRRVAFVIYRGDPDANTYCMGLAVLELAPGSRPRLVDQGGEIQLTEIANRGTIWGIGMPAMVTPLWSSDGRSLAYLRRDAGITQAWIAEVHTGTARPLTHEPVDVEQIAWLPGDHGLVYASRTGRLAAAARLSAEARTGYRYDDRYVPAMSSTPLPDGTVPLTRYTVDLAGTVRPAGTGDSGRLPPDPNSPEPVLLEARDKKGRIAAMRAPLDRTSPLTRLVVRGIDGRETPCAAAACGGRVVNLWWLDGAVVFLRREGWDNGDMALYRWRPGSGAPRRLFATSGLVEDCTPARLRLICLAETAARPQRIVAIDSRSGAVETLYDPNPEFRAIRLGRVERLKWRNANGLEVRGDLVLPPGYVPGTRLPLIVTTYTSDGFLRGALGDEYPIQVLAAHGFAVLSYQRPRSVELDGQAPGVGAEAVVAQTRAWAERRSVHSAVLEGVRRVVDMGIADPARVGISGLSDGSSTSEFALINSRAFAAAAVSTCCLEPWTVDEAMGPTFAAAKRATGWPANWANDREFWATGSIVQNVAKIDTPLLIQQSDREYLYALEAFSALRENGKPVDLYVFPDEYHHKWQPAHKLAIYRRNLDWFRFWLQGVADPDPSKAEQYAHWEALKTAWRKGA